MINIGPFSLQINIIDPLQTETDPRFDDLLIPGTNKRITRSPVFQIFGTTERGEHECIIVHGFYPEIYVSTPCIADVNNQQNPEADSEMKQYITEIIAYIERKFGDQCILSYDLVQKTSVYGYQGEKTFLRLFLLRTDQQAQLFQHLTCFAWNGEPIKVCEAHIPPFIKFLAKYNLTGFGYMHLSQCFRCDPKFSTYKSELHCRVDDIEIEDYHSSQILGHLKFIWNEQHNLRRRLGIASEAPVTMFERKDIIFTQRVPKLEDLYTQKTQITQDDASYTTQTQTQTQNTQSKASQIEIDTSDNLPKSQELEALLELLEKYDPDAEAEHVIQKEEERTQREIDDIMNDVQGIMYQTPHDFVAGRVSQCLKISETQLNPRQTIETFASKLVTTGNVSILKQKPNQKEEHDDKDENEPKEEDAIDQNQQNEPDENKENEPATSGSSLNPNSTETTSLPEKDAQDQEDDEEIITGQHGSEFIRVLFIEIGCQTRGKLLPNPAIDPVACVTFVLMMDKEVIDKVTFFVGPKIVCGQKIVSCSSEADIFAKVKEHIITIDPDIIVGYNIERESIGYMQNRGRSIGIQNYYAEISRTGRDPHATDEVRYIEGRILVNLWRVIRHAVALRSYTISATSKTYLDTEFPEIKVSQLGVWLRSSPFRYLSYFQKKVDVVVAICEEMNFIDSYCELSTILGSDFASTYSRGSQFQTESLLIRVAHSMGYILASPSKYDVAKQRAPMSLPLVMEPLSGFYSDPVLVIDFQSLYPSSMIAYNLDFCSIIGRTEDAAIGGQVGCYYHRVDKKTLEKLIQTGHVISTPNDVLYVTKDIRPGVLPATLDQILKLRAFIKQTMKKTKNKRLLSILDARQAALKAFAACSYGYTAAHYSGRMPCVELADSIVECSRHILEFTLQHIANDYEELTVLYGDTDSLFIRMPPASIKDCFEFAEKLCDDITSMFPNPIRIKIEKIYKGCFLVNKKRYVGWSYESPDQEKPKFDVKGLEMKRRDSCPFCARVMSEVIESIFKTKETQVAEQIFQSNVSKLCHGLIPIHELFFARELRLGTYKPGAEPPGYYVAKRQMEQDPMAEPLYGFRLQYLVVSSVPGSRLIDRVVSPEEYFEKNHRVCTRYYVEKQLVPALGRVLETMGVDVRSWLRDVGVDMKRLMPYSYAGKNATVIEQFYVSSQCPLCRSLCSKTNPICPHCLTRAGREESFLELQRRMKNYENKINEYQRKCCLCIGEPGTTVKACFCSGCPTFWELKVAEEQYKVYDTYRQAYNAFLSKH